MISNDTKILVVNKYSGSVGYTVPDLKVNRTFYPGERKEITFEELERLSFTPGGEVILKEYLQIKNPEAIAALLNAPPEVEYYYTKENIKNLMTNGSLDQFLDCLDFAPEAIKETIKQLAVDLPLNDVSKRQAIQEKLGFNVTRAIEIQETEFDGGQANQGDSSQKKHRRSAPPKTVDAVPTGRRYNPNKG